MQLTNICRDVAEDWQRGRLYLPAELLAGTARRLIAELERRQARSHAVVAALLARADASIAPAIAGCPRCRFALRGRGRARRACLQRHRAR